MRVLKQKIGKYMKRIMVVEDDREMAALTKSILIRNRAPAELDVQLVHDGEEAIFKLSQIFKCGSNEIPDILLVDLDMPGKSGLEVIRQLKSHKRLRRIPIVIFSGSQDKEKLAHCYDLGANSFIAKGIRGVTVLDHFAKYWLETVELPEIFQ